MSDRKGVMSKIQDILTFGYSSKEDLRELDKKLRDAYYEELRGLRHTWEEPYMTVLDEQAVLGRGFKSVIQSLDRLSAQVQRADYGYAGLFDRKGNVGNEGLSRVLDYDRNFSSQVDLLHGAIERVKVSVASKSWGQVRIDLDAAKDKLDQIEEIWKKREGLFR